MRFGSVNADIASDYGEGDRTLKWWMRVMGEFYRASAGRHGAIFFEDVEIICEWFEVVRRL